MSKKVLFINLLSLVPEPHVQAAAGVLKAILAAKASATEDPIDDSAAVDEAVAEALEPWRRIQARADVEAGRG